MKTCLFLLLLLIIQALARRHSHSRSLLRQLAFTKHSSLIHFKQHGVPQKPPGVPQKPPVPETPVDSPEKKQTPDQKKYDQMKKDISDPENPTVKEIKEKREEENKPFLPEWVKPYNSTFVNGSRPVPDRYQKIPDDWMDAKMVKQISTYSKKFLRDFHDPRMKGRAFLVGKGVYLENNRTFDQQPSIVETPQPKIVNIDVVQRKFNTQEKVNLWRKFLSEEFRQNYKDVSFNSNLTQALEDMSGIESIIKDKSVRISLQNKYKAIQQLQKQIANNEGTSIGAPDKVLENTVNPIKPVLFSKDNVKEISFSSQDVKDHLVNISPKGQGMQHRRFQKTLVPPVSPFDQFLQQATLLSQMNGTKKTAPVSSLLLNSKIYAQMLKNSAAKKFRVQNMKR